MYGLLSSYFTNTSRQQFERDLAEKDWVVILCKTMTNRVTLSAGPLSLFDEDGTAIIIHGNPDQGTTGEPKSGVSGGPRIACGVVTK